ncbi:MAG TPA: sigma-70 family RNA polymerase sigma factor [Chthonomonadales bacterium]|nr:sigma-70 family RNA polymerase sigma factor [Chthonomonadales bacterium]
MIDLLRLHLTPASATSTRDNDAVFEALVDANYRRVYNLALRMVGNEADAADLTQDIFVRIYRNLPRLRADGAQDAWVRRIATNACLDYLRHRKSIPPPSSLDAPLAADPTSTVGQQISDVAAEPARLLSEQEKREVLHRAVNSLPDEYRSVVLLHHLNDMRVEDIAVALQVPPGTVKSRLSRARQALRRKLSHYFGPAAA